MSDPSTVIDPASRVAQLAMSGIEYGWRLTVCPAAREAGGSFQRRTPRDGPINRSAPGSAADPDRSAEEAARRARSKTRKYCAANGLNRLGTLTYEGTGCHDPLELRSDVRSFFKTLRSLLGGDPFPYLWTAEWHKSGHGLHVHFAVGRFVNRGLIKEAWGHGFINIKLLGDLPVGSGRVEEARKAAGYLSKYVGKDFDAQRLPGLHRYEVAQGFQPATETVWGKTIDDVIDTASKMFRSAPVAFWTSESDPDSDGPKLVWAQWAG
jgi:hypothetical protein